MHKIAAMMDIGMDDDESDDEGSKQDNKECWEIDIALHFKSLEIQIKLNCSN